MFRSFGVIRKSISIVLLSVLIVTSTSLAGDHDCSWPQFHGPNRDNISTETHLAKSWPDKGPPSVWTVDGLGHGFSSVSIAAGRIYTAGNIEKDTVVTALDLNGKVLWRAVRSTSPAARETLIPFLFPEKVQFSTTAATAPVEKIAYTPDALALQKRQFRM